jgi:hypothetical protein
MKRSANIPVSEATRDRPWQIMLASEDIAQIDEASRQALKSILELFTEVRGLVVQTSAGRVSVTRDFSERLYDPGRSASGDDFQEQPARDRD